MLPLTPGMVEEGITPEEMEEVYQWAKQNFPLHTDLEPEKGELKNE